MQIVQKTHYPSVYKHLKEDSFPLNADGKQFVKDLGLFYEESSGLLHSRGRLHHSELDHNTVLNNDINEARPMRRAA